MTLQDFVKNWKKYLKEDFGERIVDEDGKTWEDLEYFIGRLVNLAETLEREKTRKEMSKKLSNTKKTFISHSNDNRFISKDVSNKLNLIKNKNSNKYYFDIESGSAGLDIFESPKTNFYKYLARKYNKKLLAGPSGSTCMLLTLLKLFNISVISSSFKLNNLLALVFKYF